MGKSTPQQPAPVVVNPTQSATGQASFNKEAALQQRALNMVDQYTPQGTTKYEGTGQTIEGIPQYKVTQSFSPEQQELYDLSTGTQKDYGQIAQSQLGQVRSKLEDPFDLSSLGAGPTVNEATRTATRDAMLQRLDPQYERQRASLETSLANQGFTTGTAAYNSEMDEFNRMKNDAYLGADAAAGNEMARMYGLETTARDRAINEMLMQRQQPLSELSTLISGSQPSMPGFISAPQGQVAAPDLMGAEYGSANMLNSANQNAYNQQMGTYNSNLQGLYGLGGAGLQAAGFKWGR